VSDSVEVGPGAGVVCIVGAGAFLMSGSPVRDCTMTGALVPDESFVIAVNVEDVADFADFAEIRDVTICTDDDCR